MRALWVGLVVCLLGAAAYGLSVLLELRAATLPPTPSAFVQATWSVYRFGPGHETHVGRLGLDCKACHQSTADGKFDAPGPGPCISCHEARSDIQHAMVHLDALGQRVPEHEGERRVADCLKCHGFGPDPHQKPTDCLVCHVRAQDSTPAIVTHADNACESCHAVHENSVTPQACGTCHQVTAHHGRGDVSSDQACLDCHRAHDRAESAPGRCRECHLPETRATEGVRQATAVPASATFQGHSCTGCHRPHDFHTKNAETCKSCHTAVQTLKGKGHTECAACHTPHAVRDSVAGNVCVRCHQDVALKHGTPVDPKATCTGCHAPHPSATHLASTHGGTTPCAACHQDVGKQGRSAHAGDLVCAHCHRPHGFALEGGQAECTKCHAAQAALVKKREGHGSCAGCHQNLPHGADLSAGACSTCHQKVRTHAGHSTCTQCHEPHSGARGEKQCGDCHANEAKVAIHPAKSVRCTQCHEQHEATLKVGVGDCSSCHDRKRLPGLHDVPQHAAACTSCHQPHDARAPGARATCLSCHTDRHDHQPEATRCTGCHQFVRAPRGKGGAL